MLTSKKTIFFSLTLLAVVSLSSLLALFAARKVATVHINASQNPDFFMTNSSYIDFDQNGEIHSQISTDKITHFANNNVYYFDIPRLSMFTSKEQPWIISANKGKSEHGKEKVFLWDNVNVQQTAGNNNPETKISTTELTIFPHKKTAETNKPVVITQGGNVMQATGAKADFKTGSINLLSKVVGKYIPTTTKKAGSK